MTINCPVCGGATAVTNNYSDSESVWRRRCCKECKHVFYTTEEELDSSKKNFLEYQSVAETERRYRRRYGSAAVESQNKVKGNSNGN